MNPNAQQLMLQALAQRSAAGNMGHMAMPQRQIPETVPQGQPQLTPQALQARQALQQLQMMQRLGSPVYSQSPMRQPNSTMMPQSNQFNTQAQMAFAPTAQPMPGR